MKGLEQVSIRTADIEQASFFRNFDPTQHELQQDYGPGPTSELRVEQVRLVTAGLMVDIIARVDAVRHLAPVVIQDFLDCLAPRTNRPLDATVDGLYIR